MKRLSRFLLPLLLLVNAAISAAAENAPALLPHAPGHLLGVLPATPAEWKLVRSGAETSLGEWLEARATRVFQAPPPTADAPEEKAGGEVEISVLDTGGFRPALAAFADFRPGKSGVVEKALIGSLPAITVQGDDGRQFTQVLVAARYVVEITLTHLPRQRAETWLRTLRFDALPAVSAPPAITRLREVRLQHLDELHPARNRSYTVSTTNAQSVTKFLQTLPEEPASSAILR